MNNLFYLAAKIDADKAGIPANAADDTLANVLNVVYIVAGFTGVIVIIFGGIFYAISGGDASRVKFAKDTILYAVVGLVVIASAFILTNFVIGSF